MHGMDVVHGNMADLFYNFRIISQPKTPTKVGIQIPNIGITEPSGYESISSLLTKFIPPFEF